MKTQEELRALLIEAGLITEDASPNRSDQFVCKCWICESKKLYVNSREGDDKFGVYMCQKCQNKGNLQSLELSLAPLTDEEELFLAIVTFAQEYIWNTDDTAALDNLHDRGFTDEEIRRYGFGYLVKGWTNDFDAAILEEYGLISSSDQPIFWDHIVIPYYKNGRVETIKGRCLDESVTKKKYISVLGKTVPLYQPSEIERAKKTFLTEGEFKAAYLDKNGLQALGISGAGNAKKYLSLLNSYPNLYIVLDSDQPTELYPQGCGQQSAKSLAEKLDNCHVIFLPLGDDKVGVDDYIIEYGVEEFEKLVNTAQHYVNGVVQRSTSLAIAVSDWKQRAKSVDTYVGFNCGFPRLDDKLGGIQPGSLGYLLGAPHHAKTALLRSLALNLYELNPNLFIDYNSNDDSLKVTLAHFIASTGGLNQSDVKQPLIAYANDKSGMKRWEQATEKLASMADRLKVVDRSFRRSLESITEEVLKWRVDNPNGQRIILIDGFNKIYCEETANMEDGRMASVKKSDQLKLLAQQADVPVLVTIDTPKLYGRRPTSGDMAGSAAMEFDTDILIGCYIDAQSKGNIAATALKMEVEYEDGNSDTVPVIEYAVLKNKQTGDNELDLMLLDKTTSTLHELGDEDYPVMKKLVLQSMRDRDN